MRHLVAGAIQPLIPKRTRRATLDRGRHSSAPAPLSSTHGRLARSNTDGSVPRQIPTWIHREESQ
jgi:hypothetical protein